MPGLAWISLRETTRGRWWARRPLKISRRPGVKMPRQFQWRNRFRGARGAALAGGTVNEGGRLRGGRGR